MSAEVSFPGYSEIEKERLLTAVLYPPWLMRFSLRCVPKLYAAAERWAGVDPEAEWDGTEDRSTWALRCRVVDFIGDRLDDLGLWANRRKAARRLRARRGL